MFEKLSSRLTETFRFLRNQSSFNEKNLDEIIRDVRVALLEADVAVPVVKDLVQSVRDSILGKKIDIHLKPEQAFIKILNEKLIEILGSDHSALDFKTEPPMVILLAGLQGSGKTTSAAKLALTLKDKKVMLTSADVYRPAAKEQLKILTEQVGASYFDSETLHDPLDIAKKALDAAKKQFMDVLIIDTAGRLHIDDTLMKEIEAIHKAVHPKETLFVVDSMTGQDAINTAEAFHKILPLTGVILTKTDGDARGGAALSIRHVTGKPIKFIGTGEKIDALSPFYPERVASQILGMGDMLTLIEDMERKADKATSEKLTAKLKQGKIFDLNDMKQQLLQMKNMGSLSDLVSKLPGLGNIMTQGLDQMGEKTIKQTIAIIDSMTKKERRNPKIIVGSRKRRIAEGSGSGIPDVNRVLKQYKSMQDMAEKFNKPGGMQKMLRGLQGMPGLKGMLPGFPNNFKKK